MALYRFSRIFSKSKELILLQDVLEKIFKQILEVDLLDGVLIEDVTIGTSTTLVQHKLNKKYRYWLVLDKDANATIYRDTTSTADNTKFLPLIASTETTVTLWVI